METTPGVNMLSLNWKEMPYRRLGGRVEGRNLRPSGEIFSNPTNSGPKDGAPVLMDPQQGVRRAGMTRYLKKKICRFLRGQETWR